MTDEQWLACRAVFQAYNAMETTKRRHFEYLTMLDTAWTKWNLEPTSKQETMRERLLADHNRQVQTFTTASSELKTSDRDAFNALWVYIGEINTEFQPLNERTGH
jgi:hypothetical protein